MKSGDRVVVPSIGSFSVYRVTEKEAAPVGCINIDDLKTWFGEPVVFKNNLLFCNGSVDIGFVREVQPVALNLSRNLFADAALTSRLKIRGTTTDISDLRENVDRAIEAFRSNRPISLHSILLEEHTQTTLNAIIKDLTPAKFERLIAWYFRKVGATQVDIPAKNESGKEGDADIVATFDALRIIIYVQAKYHTGQTNDWAVKQIQKYRDKKDPLLNDEEVLDDGYSRIAWVISTADTFSEECLALAKENKVSLFNGKDFSRLLSSVGLEGLDAAI